MNHLPSRTIRAVKVAALVVDGLAFMVSEIHIAGHGKIPASAAFMDSLVTC